MTTLSSIIPFHQERPVADTAKSNRLDVWSAFRIGMRLKTNAANSYRSILGNLVKVSHKPRLLSRALTPIDFVRFREFDFALRAVTQFMPAPRNVLDISSPKLLPLTIASRLPHAQVTITDILQREAAWAGNAANRLGLTNVTAHTEDARALTFSDNRFDLITSISVFEHIAPEHGGEIPAVKELARVLAPGGVAIITLPFSRKYFADYQVGNVYERNGTSNEPIFFQRFYDSELLQRNIVEASGLELQNLTYIDERNFLKNPRRRMSHFINGTPNQVALFGPLYPLLAHIFLSQPKPLAACVKPYLACVVLQKPK